MGGGDGEGAAAKLTNCSYRRLVWFVLDSSELSFFCTSFYLQFKNFARTDQESNNLHICALSLLS